MSWTPLDRAFRAFNPRQTEAKRSDALRFGILGAANSAGMTLTIPAKLHPEVVVQAVAARNRKRAEEFAKKHGIPEVKDSYQEILDDPNIDCVLVPLPNALHFEWAARAVRAGKHVLLEKPSVSNSIEAEMLFNMSELDGGIGDGPRKAPPVILEAFHYRFHPAWRLFSSLVRPADVVHVDTWSMIPWWFVGDDHIHFNYDLAGGAMMGMGTYNFAALRTCFGAEPEECVSCDVQALTEGVHHDCDHTFHARFRFPGGGIGEARSTLKGPTIWRPSWATATHRAVAVADPSLPADQEKLVTREVTIHGWIHAIFWHRVDVKEHFEIRTKGDDRVVKKWTETKTHKAYTYREAAASVSAGKSSGGGEELVEMPGEKDTWMSFRYQLDDFVNRVKGRDTRYWVSREDSLLQMKMIDMAYEKSGLGIRPTSKFKV